MIFINNCFNMNQIAVINGVLERKWKWKLKEVS